MFEIDSCLDYLQNINEKLILLRAGHIPNCGAGPGSQWVPGPYDPAGAPASGGAASGGSCQQISQTLASIILYL